MTLAANFRLGAFGEKWRVLSDFGELEAIGGFLHDRVAINATDTPARVRARIPIRLDSTLMTREAGLILKLNGFPGILPERDQSADALSAAGSDVIASRSMAILASLSLGFVPRIEQKNFAHHGLGKLFELRRVASLTDFVPDIGRRFLLGGTGFGSK
jgi:hypothetical protein